MSVIRLFGCSVLLSAVLLSASASGQTPLGTEFTYQGQLKAAGVPAGGDFDFIFRLYDGDGGGGGGSQIGGDVLVDDWAVVDGLFTVQLDFGGGIFTGDRRWLEVSVRPGESTGSYTVLSPRQPLTAAPYALYALDSLGGGGHWTLGGDNIYNNNAGNVGIGTGNPSSNLHVHEIGSGSPTPPARIGVDWFQPANLHDWFSVEVGGLGNAGSRWGPGTRLIREAGTSLQFQTEEQMNSGTGLTQMTLTAAGKLGIGTTNPDAMLDAHNDSPATDASAVRGAITSTSPGVGSAGVWGHNNGTTLSGQGVKGTHDGFGTGVYGLSTNGIGVYGKSINGTYAGWFDGAVKVEGTVTADVLEITGADLAEKFPVSEKVEPGMVVAIDPDHPGQLCVARGSYNRCVAGVVSGANNLSAGAVLGNLPGNEDAPAIALTGRVWVYCDASNHAITPGDLLTTATTPGHAMKVIDYPRAQGAIIGKAMSSLGKGEKGLVLVLVSLQ